MMGSNTDRITINLIGVVTELFSAAGEEVKAFLNAWDNELYIFKDTISQKGRLLEELVQDLKEYAVDKSYIEEK